MLWCRAGGGTYGQLGNGMYVSKPTPVAVLGDYNFSQLASGGAAACGILVNNSASCWGKSALSRGAGSPVLHSNLQTGPDQPSASRLLSR
jgi:hypothetical protein